MAEETQDLIAAATTPPTSPGAAAALRAETAPVAAEAAPVASEAAKPPAAARPKASGKATEYVVFRSEDREGPFTLVDTYITQGQTNAKREGAKTVGIDDAAQYFFTAVPTSSFRPEKPIITLQITFATEDSTDAADDEE